MIGSGPQRNDPSDTSGRAPSRALPLLRWSQAIHTGAAAGWAADPALWPWALAAVGVNHLALMSAVLSPRSRWLGPNLVRTSATEAIALTFDDGPDPVLTPYVLDTLKSYGARASFFCIGSRAERYPECVQAVIAGGHSIENHSHSHPLYFALMGPQQLARELDAAQAALTQTAGVAPTFFRAPMGFRSPLLHGILRERGLRYASWTRRGFDTANRSSASVLQHLTRGLSGGDILLLHDGRSARTRRGVPVLREVLPRLLDTLLEANLRVLPLPELVPSEALPPGARA